MVHTRITFADLDEHGRLVVNVALPSTRGNQQLFVLVTATQVDENGQLRAMASASELVHQAEGEDDVLITVNVPYTTVGFSPDLPLSTQSQVIYSWPSHLVPSSGSGHVWKVQHDGQFLPGEPEPD
jgi:hypothetical protein